MIINEYGKKRLICDNCETVADVEYAKKHNQVISLAVEALKEKAERSKGCVWCNENNKVYHDGQHFHFFCSYCGKRLEEEP